MDKIIGIYKITNSLNGKIYIGSSVNCKARWSSHKCKSSDQYVSRVIRKYGSDNFTFEVIEECKIDDIMIKEQYYLDKYKPYLRDKGYNIAKCAEFPQLNAKKTKIQIEAASTNGKKYKGKNNPFYGKNHSDETKKHLRKVKKGKNTGKANPNYGRKHTKDALKKISEASIGRDNKLSIEVHKIDKNTGEILKTYKSMADAAQDVWGDRKKQNYVSRVCSGKFKTAGGYKWMIS